MVPPRSIGVRAATVAGSACCVVAAVVLPGGHPDTSRGSARHWSVVEVDTSRLVDLAPAAAREDFAAGITALHDFWYEEAEERFRAVQKSAPRFSLGYWGEALALQRRPFGFAEPPGDRMRAILERLAPTPEARAALASTDRERGYLAALEVLIADRDSPAERHPAYAQAMAELARRYPADVEAQAFYARAAMLTASSFGRSRAAQERTAAAASAVLRLDPSHHGGLHYYIHAMDDPASAADALDEADRYQVVAVGSSHALHMPSHIYMQLGLWDRVVSGNEAALRASAEAIERRGGTRADLDRHAMDFLFYALLQQGRESDARALLGRARADREAFDARGIRRFEASWTAEYALTVGDRDRLPEFRSGFASPGEVLGYGLHAAAVGEPNRARSYLEEARDHYADGKGTIWRIVVLELEAAIDGGPAAVDRLREAIELQSDLSRPTETADPVKPPGELLGEILLAHDRPAEALAAFEASERRRASRLATRLGMARALVALGDTTRSRAAYAALLEQLRLADPEHPARAEAGSYLESTGGVPTGTLLETVLGRAPGTLPEVGIVGTGPVDMVIIPCMSCGWRSFDTFMERNAERYTMHAVTLPGFGGTPAPDLPVNTGGPVWYTNAVDAISRHIAAEGLDDVVLVGHSYGAVVAVGVANRLPDRVRALVNVDGNFMSDRSWFAEEPALRRAKAEEVVAYYQPRFADADYRRSFNRSSRPEAARRALYHGMFMATSPVVLLQYWQENHLVDLNAMLAKLDVPILDLKSFPRGADADSVRRDRLDELRRNGVPPSVHTVFLPETTHYVMEHRPEVMDRILSEFLRGDVPADFDPSAPEHRRVEDVAMAWVSAYRGSLREDADSASIGRLMALYDEDVVFVSHPSGVRVEGKANLHSDAVASSRLGIARQPVVDLQSIVVARDDVVLTLAVEVEVREEEDWTTLRRHEAYILRVRGGRISHVTEYRPVAAPDGSR